MTLVRVVLVVVSLTSLQALAQRCDAAALSDSVCDCGCGVVDSACPAGTFVVCEVSRCTGGQVPWEHQPHTCMASACGDGWKDPARGEACDDGNALASGGCSADCRSVNPGYVCEDGARGCRLAPTDAGASAPDAGQPPDAGAPDRGAGDAGTTMAPEPMPTTPGGCSTSVVLGLPLLGLGLLRRVRRKG